jgi:hypothetical protein
MVGLAQDCAVGTDFLSGGDFSVAELFYVPICGTFFRCILLSEAPGPSRERQRSLRRAVCFLQLRGSRTLRRQVQKKLSPAEAQSRDGAHA